MLGLIDAGAKAFLRETRGFIAEPGSISIVNPGDLHTGSRADGDRGTQRRRCLVMTGHAIWGARGKAWPAAPLTWLAEFQ